MGIEKFKRPLLVIDEVVPDGSGGGGAYPTGTERQVAGFDEDGNPAAVTLGWSQFSDLPEPPTFGNGVLVMSATEDPANPIFGFVEITDDAATPNTIPWRVPGLNGGQIKTANPADGDDAVNLTYLNTEITNLTNYINAGDSELRGLIDSLTARVAALEAP
jgi:hypothetical protein